MHPFPSRLQWFLKGRHAHVIAATEEKLHRLGIERRERAQARIASMRRLALAQLPLLVLLYIGAIATATGALVGILGLPDETVDAMQYVAARAAPLSGVLLVAVLLLRRTLSQLEADLVMLVALRGT